MVKVAKQSVIALANKGLRYEQVNANLAQKRIAWARNKLAPMLPTTALNALDDILGEAYKGIQSDFQTATTFEEGQLQGKAMVAESVNIPTGSAFSLWMPLPPLNALALSESEFAALITAAKDSLKQDILKGIRLSLAEGVNLQDQMARVLGTGIKGTKGRDGVFRSASFRAEAIARTVTNDLLNRGAHNSYDQIAAISPELDLKKEWATVSDSRTSDRCRSLNGQVRPLDQVFTASDGWSGKNPPSHPFCRSRVVASVGGSYSEESDQKFQVANRLQHNRSEWDSIKETEKKARKKTRVTNPREVK